MRVGLSGMRKLRPVRAFGRAGGLVCGWLSLAFARSDPAPTRPDRLCRFAQFLSRAHSLGRQTLTRARFGHSKLPATAWLRLNEANDGNTDLSF